MVSEQRDPLELFDEWFKAAAEREPNDPTQWRSPASGRTACRRCAWCCSKAWTTAVRLPPTTRAAGPQLLAHPQAALCFHWRHRSAGCGSSSRAGDTGRGRRLLRDPGAHQPDGAWASQQSRPLTGSRLEAGCPVHRQIRDRRRAAPPYSGFRVLPRLINSGRIGRSAHDRLVYHRGVTDGGPSAYIPEMRAMTSSSGQCHPLPPT